MAVTVSFHQFKATSIGGFVFYAMLLYLYLNGVEAGRVRESQGFGELAAGGGAGDADGVDSVSPAAGDGKRAAFPRGRQAGVDDQRVVVGLDAEDELRDRVPVPRGGAGEPAVLAFAGLDGVFSGHHLRIDVWFYLVKILVFDKCRRNL